MRSFRHAVACAALILLPAAFTAAQTSTTKKKSSSTAAKKRSSTARKTGTKTATKTGTKPGTKKKGATASAPRQTWRTRQLQPTEQRYKEIQSALVSKGYMQGEPTGTWNQESIDAMRRFQQDQKLEPTGKIDSLSLIALGLGPKHETAKASPPPQPTTPAAN